MITAVNSPVLTVCKVLIVTPTPHFIIAECYEVNTPNLQTRKMRHGENNYFLNFLGSSGTKNETYGGDYKSREEKEMNEFVRTLQ